MLLKKHLKKKNRVLRSKLNSILSYVDARLNPGSLIKISPGDYFLAPTSQGKITLKDETKGLLVKQEGYDIQKCMGFYSALVNNSVILVWQDKFEAVI